MFKNFSILTIIFFTICLNAISMTMEEGKEAFAKYIEYSNTYDKNLKKMYDKTTIIKRVVTKKDGTQYEKILSVDMYKTMLTYYSKIACWQGYKNTYTNIKFKKTGNDIEVTCIRHPSTSEDKLPAKIIFTKNEFGRVIIKEESFNTNAAFLVR